MIQTKSILAPIELIDGVRYSIMSRHTHNDGKTPDPRITSDLYHDHLIEFAPPLRLIGNYYRGGLDWEDFENRYIKFLRSNELPEKVSGLARTGLYSDITLMCIEETPERCHRKLLAEECVVHKPELILRIN